MTSFYNYVHNWIWTQRVTPDGLLVESLRLKEQILRLKTQGEGVYKKTKYIYYFISVFNKQNQTSNDVSTTVGFTRLMLTDLLIQIECWFFMLHRSYPSNLVGRDLLIYGGQLQDIYKTEPRRNDFKVKFLNLTFTLRRLPVTPIVTSVRHLCNFTMFLNLNLQNPKQRQKLLTTQIICDI